MYLSSRRRGAARVRAGTAVARPDWATGRASRATRPPPGHVHVTRDARALSLGHSRQLAQEDIQLGVPRRPDTVRNRSSYSHRELIL